MTSGIDNRDQLYTVNGPFGQVTGGRYYRKQWTGDDRASLSSTAETPKYQYVSELRRRKVLKWKAHPREGETVVFFRKVKVVVRTRKGRMKTISKRVRMTAHKRFGLRPYRVWEEYTATKLRRIWTPKAAKPKKSDPGYRTPHALTLSWYTAENHPVDCWHPWWGGFYAPLMVPGIASYVASQKGANDELRLLGKLRERVAGSEFNMATFLAEGGRSLEMIGNAANRIYRCYRSLRKGDFISAYKELSLASPTRKAEIKLRGKSLQHNWLELQYGWRPLIEDASAGAKHLAQMSEVGFNRRVVARTKIVGATNVSPSSAYVFAQSEDVMMLQIVAYLDEVNVPKLIGLSDPSETLWELVPYSFVVDWFMPIGNFLSARALSSALKGTYIRTETIKASGSGYRYKVPPTEAEKPWTADIGPLSNAVFRQTYVTRTILTSLDVPLPQPVELGKAASWTRAANAVALLTASR